MDVYIEYVVIDNLVINGLLLWAAGLTAKVKLNAWKVLSSAGVGTVFACLMPLVSLPSLVLALIKLALAPLLAFLAFWPLKARKLMWSTFIFAAYTFVLGGAIVALIYLGLDMTVEKAAVYYNAKVPVGAFLGGIAASGFLLKSLMDYINFQRKIRPLLKKVRLEAGGKEVFWEGFADSGNSLTVNGLPVCFVSGKAAAKLVREEIAGAVLGGEKICKGDYMTVAGVSSFKGIEKDIEIDGKPVRIILASSKVRSKNYDIILNGILGENNED